MAGTSTFTTFTVLEESSAGVQTSVGAGVSVYVYSEDLAADVAESPLTTDSNGDVVATTISTDVGKRVHFRVENHNGKAGSVTQITI